MDRNELEKYISENYKSEAEHLWSSHPTFAVFRHADNRKWFAVIMDIAKNKLGISGSEHVSVVNLKCDPILAGSLRYEHGIFPAYHMNKEKWISVLLDGSVDREKLIFLLNMSYDLTASRKKNRK